MNVLSFSVPVDEKSDSWAYSACIVIISIIYSLAIVTIFTQTIPRKEYSAENRDMYCSVCGTCYTLATLQRLNLLK